MWVLHAWVLSFHFPIAPHLDIIINTTTPRKVIQASAFALHYGSKDLKIRERMLPLGFFWTRMVSIFALFPMLCVQASLALGLGILKIPLVGKFLCDRLAPPGSGAPDWLVNLGSCAVYVEVTGMPPNDNDNEPSGGVHKGYAHMEFTGDPGNAVTAQCVVESALTLWLNQDTLPPKSLDGFGTPAELLGTALLKRLQHTTVRPVKLTTTARLNVPPNERKVYL